MTYIVSGVAFILLLTFLILIHELGHYLLARLFGVKVEEFGFGLPPKATVLFVRAGTAFTLNWIPFGGFVRLQGENAIDLSARTAPGSFGHAGVGARILILSGGVIMNFCFAFVLLTMGFSVGHWVPNFYASVEQLQEAALRGDITMRPGVYINDILPDSTAQRAGLQKDSVIDAVDGVHVTDPNQLIALQQGKSSVVYTIREPKSQVQHTVVVPLEDGKSGVAVSLFVQNLSAPRRPLATAISFALRETVFMTSQTIQGIGHLMSSLVTTAHVPEGITGIVGIAKLTYGSVQVGFMTYLRLVALLSLSLAILNILPLPALDGGRLLFVLVELVLRRPLNQQFELITNTAGFFLLIGLILIITLNDVIHLF